MTTEPKKKHRMNVNFADSTYRVLEDLATKQGKTKAEILRDVITLGKYIQDTKDEGGHILIERGGKTYELLMASDIAT